MTVQDKVFMGFYALCTLIALIIGVMKVIKAKEKEEVTDGWMIILLAFTPGIMLIGGILVMIGFVFLITEGPSTLIWKIKTLAYGRRNSRT